MPSVIKVALRCKSFKYFPSTPGALVVRAEEPGGRDPEAAQHVRLRHRLERQQHSPRLYAGSRQHSRANQVSNESFTSALTLVTVS